MLLNDDRPLLEQIDSKIYDKLFRIEPLNDTIAYLDYDVSGSEGLQNIEQYFCQYTEEEYAKKMRTDAYIRPYPVRTTW